MGLAKFTSIFSVRCVDDDHINIRECRALLFYVRWLLRSTGRHRHRVIVLVDSKVVVGSVTKGRSGSRILHAWVRRIHCLGLRWRIETDAYLRAFRAQPIGLSVQRCPAARQAQASCCMHSLSGLWRMPGEPSLAGAKTFARQRIGMHKHGGLGSRVH